MKPQPVSYFKLKQVDVAELLIKNKQARDMHALFGECARFIIGAKANKDHDWKEFQFDFKCPKDKEEMVRKYVMDVMNTMPKTDRTIYAGEHD
jgi:hypothetical protein